MKKLTLLFTVFIYVATFAQKKSSWTEVAERQAITSFGEFYDLLSLANDAHFPTDIEKNIVWCEAAFAKRGFTSQRLATPTVPLLKRDGVTRCTLLDARHLTAC